MCRVLAPFSAHLACTSEDRGNTSLNHAKALERLWCVPLFATLGKKDLRDAVKNLEVMEYAAGDDIIVQGDKGDTFFVIDRGECTINVDGQQVALIKAGQTFGERSLLRKTTRAATIKAQSPVKCLMMTRHTFTQLIKERERRENMVRGAKLFETFTDDQVAKLAGAIERERYDAAVGAAPCHSCLCFRAWFRWASRSAGRDTRREVFCGMEGKVLH